MPSLRFALTACAALLVTAGAARAQIVSSPWNGAFADHRGRTISDHHRHGRHDWRRHRAPDFYGNAGLPFYPEVLPGDDDDRRPVVLPQPPEPQGPARTMVDVRTHPTYSELPYYARTAAPSLQRIVRTRHGVRIETTRFEVPLTQDVPLTTQP